jgi:hypothetical protein
MGTTQGKHLDDRGQITQGKEKTLLETQQLGQEEQPQNQIQTTKHIIHEKWQIKTYTTEDPNNPIHPQYAKDYTIFYTSHI